MKFTIFLCLIYTLSMHSQIVINIGPFNSNLQDPLGNSQETRATSEDRKMIPKVTAMATEIQAVRKFVVDYEKSLETISSPLESKKKEVDDFLDECISYIVAKNSITGNIPGLKKLAVKSRLIEFFQTNKIRSLKTELKDLFKTDNYMTEGERKVILLGIIDRALQLTI
jgi:hypothetical protein